MEHELLEHTCVVRSINLSHKQIVKWAKDIGMKEICIAEDDLMFTAPNAWEYFLSQKPEVFDIYLWGSYIVPLSNKKICGFQMYIIRDQFYDTFLSIDENQHIDTATCDLKGDYHYCYPFPCLQRSCWSANARAKVNYNTILKPEDIWKGSHL